MCHITQGRHDLARGRETMPDTFFTCDANLQRVLRYTIPVMPATRLS